MEEVHKEGHCPHKRLDMPVCRAETTTCIAGEAVDHAEAERKLTFGEGPTRLHSHNRGRPQLGPEVRQNFTVELGRAARPPARLRACVPSSSLPLYEPLSPFDQTRTQCA